MVVEPHLRKYPGVVFHLTAKAEARVRLANVTVGAVLGTHFAEFEANAFRCFEVPADVVLALPFGQPSVVHRFTTPSSRAKCAGVDPKLVSSLPGLLGHCNESELEALVDIGIHAVVKPDLDPLQAISNRLMSLYKPCLGAVKHRFTVEGILGYLELSTYLKKTASSI